MSNKYWNVRICTLEELESVLNEVNRDYVVLDIIALHTTSNGDHLMGVIYVDPGSAVDSAQLMNTVASRLTGTDGDEVLGDWNPTKKDRPQ